MSRIVAFIINFKFTLSTQLFTINNKITHLVAHAVVLSRVNSAWLALDLNDQLISLFNFPCLATILWKHYCCVFHLSPKVSQDFHENIIVLKIATMQHENHIIKQQFNVEIQPNAFETETLMTSKLMPVNEFNVITAIKSACIMRKVW